MLLPSIFLTAADAEVNVVMGLELGADDYICKPFRVNELMARIKSVLRRAGRGEDKGSADSSANIERIGNLSIYTNEAKVTVKNEETGKEENMVGNFVHGEGEKLVSGSENAEVF